MALLILHKYRLLNSAKVNNRQILVDWSRMALLIWTACALSLRCQ